MLRGVILIDTALTHSVQKNANKLQRDRKTLDTDCL